MESIFYKIRDATFQKKDLIYFDRYSDLNIIDINYDNFYDDLHILPKNVSSLIINLKDCSNLTIPKNIKTIFLHDLNVIPILDNNIKIIFLSKTYLTKFPEILNNLPKNLKGIILESNLPTINIKNLPSSIEYLFIQNNEAINENDIYNDICFLINNLTNLKKIIIGTNNFNLNFNFNDKIIWLDNTIVDYNRTFCNKCFTLSQSLVNCHYAIVYGIYLYGL